MSLTEPVRTGPGAGTFTKSSGSSTELKLAGALVDRSRTSCCWT
jgi:hypothetical protein